MAEDINKDVSNDEKLGKFQPNRKLTTNWQQSLNWLRLLMIMVLILGVCFRFINLDRKVYWVDEAYTSLRIAGYKDSELVRQVSSSQVINIKDLQKYQRINPEKSLIDTAIYSATETPEHPPLYYMMARSWVQLFGDSVAVTRSLSAVISLLVFPCIYWLCVELFESSLVAWIGVALIAVSPFHVLYAQEAREYSLWIVAIMLSSVTLLRAIRLDKESGNATRVSTWSIYALTLALGLYSHLYIVLIAVGHGIYVFAIERFRLSKTVIAFGLASLSGFLAFTPWIAFIVTNYNEISKSIGWQGKSRESILFLVKNWMGNLSRVFIDFGFKADSPAIYLIPFGAIILLVSIMAMFAIYFVCRKAPKRVWLFILTLLGVTALFLVVPDLVSGGRRSTMSRYLLPSYIAIELAVAYLFATQITAITTSTRRQHLWQVGAIALLSLGIISCAISSQSSTWWNKYTSNQNFEFARIINQASSPLIINDPRGDGGNFPNVGNLLSLSYMLDSKVQLQLVVKPNIPKIPDGFSDIFLFLPTEELQAGIKKQNYKIDSIYKDEEQIWLGKLRSHD